MRQTALCLPDRLLGFPEGLEVRLGATGGLREGLPGSGEASLCGWAVEPRLLPSEAPALCDGRKVGALVRQHFLEHVACQVGVVGDDEESVLVAAAGRTDVEAAVVVAAVTKDLDALYARLLESVRRNRSGAGPQPAQPSGTSTASCARRSTTPSARGRSPATPLRSLTHRSAAPGPIAGAR